MQNDSELSSDGTGRISWEWSAINQFVYSLIYPMNYHILGLNHTEPGLFFSKFSSWSTSNVRTLTRVFLCSLNDEVYSMLVGYCGLMIIFLHFEAMTNTLSLMLSLHLSGSNLDCVLCKQSPSLEV